ncbi:MAG: SDR family oxidoreductase [Thermoguttaceae bacterium]|jgi:nucleoside-diphosphate-sugar epimerase
MTKLIVGCGYLGLHVAKQWLEAGQAVVGVTRSPARAEELKQQGVEGVVADITRPQTLKVLPEAETVLFAVGYDATSGRSRRDYYVSGLQAVLKALSTKIERFVLISSTAVYGQTKGQWIDEDSPCLPISEAGSAFLEAENALAASQFGPCAVILRLAGLYGPGRLLRRAKDLLAGNLIMAEKERYLNLIHVEDAAAIVIAAQRHAKQPRTYIAADGHPVKYRDYITHLAKLLNVANPQFQEAMSWQTDKNRRSSNKRLSNARMRTELGVQLKYPTYKDGLNAVFAEEGG